MPPTGFAGPVWFLPPAATWKVEHCRPCFASVAKNRHAQLDIVLFVRRNRQRRVEREAVLLGNDHFQTGRSGGHAGSISGLPTPGAGGESEDCHRSGDCGASSLMRE